jgi:hypothetical protein
MGRMKLQADLSGVKNIIEEMKNSFQKKNFSDVFRIARDDLIKLMSDSIEGQRTPSGETYKPYTQDTIKFKNRHNIVVKSPLIQNGTLLDRIKNPKFGEYILTPYTLIMWPHTNSTFEHQVNTHNEGNPSNRMFKNLAPILARRFIPNQEEFNKIGEKAFQGVLAELSK